IVTGLGSAFGAFPEPAKGSANSSRLRRAASLIRKCGFPLAVASAVLAVALHFFESAQAEKRTAKRQENQQHLLDELKQQSQRTAQILSNVQRQALIAT